MGAIGLNPPVRTDVTALADAGFVDCRLSVVAAVAGA